MTYPRIGKVEGEWAENPKIPIGKIIIHASAVAVSS
jgi:hypothetical protein